jgi:hypothetical protein
LQFCVAKIRRTYFQGLLQQDDRDWVAIVEQQGKKGDKKPHITEKGYRQEQILFLLEHKVVFTDKELDTGEMVLRGDSVFVPVPSVEFGAGLSSVIKSVYLLDEGVGEHDVFGDIAGYDFQYDTGVESCAFWLEGVWETIKRQLRHDEHSLENWLQIIPRPFALHLRQVLPQTHRFHEMSIWG